jgi:hypothetical protein
MDLCHSRPAEFSQFLFPPACPRQPEGGLFQASWHWPGRGGAPGVRAGWTDRAPAWTRPARVLLASSPPPPSGRSPLSRDRQGPAIELPTGDPDPGSDVAVAVQPVLALGARPGGARRRDAALTTRVDARPAVPRPLHLHALPRADLDRERPAVGRDAVPVGVPLSAGWRRVPRPGRWASCSRCPGPPGGAGRAGGHGRLPRPVGRLVPMLLLAALAEQLALVPCHGRAPASRPSTVASLGPGTSRSCSCRFTESRRCMGHAVGHRSRKQVVNSHGGSALADWKTSSGQRSSRSRSARVGHPAIYPVRYVVVHRDLGLGRIWQPARAPA